MFHFSNELSKGKKINQKYEKLPFSKNFCVLLHFFPELNETPDFSSIEIKNPIILINTKKVPNSTFRLVCLFHKIHKKFIIY